MHRALLLALFTPLLFACRTAEEKYEEIEYPVMVLSDAQVEFGEADWGSTSTRTVVLSNHGGMPMGVGSVTIGENMFDQFTVAYSASQIECSGGSGGDTGGASAKDTGSGGGGDTDGGGGEDSGTVDLESGALFVLDPGCQIPLEVSFVPSGVGQLWGALIVESVQAELSAEDEEAGEDLPAYLRDPVHWKQIVYLHGETEHTQGTLVVRPRSYDFGFVHPDSTDDEDPARITLSNVGDGDVTLGTATLASNCDASFSITSAFTDGAVLAPDQSTLVEVSFVPTDTDPALCELEITSDDEANPSVDVTFTGNSGTDPENQPPTVYVRSPDNGYRYNAIGPLEMELNVFDVNQPATSLYCKVKSAVLGLVSIANCTPDDESGHVFVDIDAENFNQGSDTLLVTVTDGSQTSAYASVSILVNSEYPEDDDDGDGFGVGIEPEDCDDANPFTYPEAAEIFDGEDNDCDSLVDEETSGYDDDGDSYSEVGGDCNDNSNDVYPAGPETGDGMDNDCDGIVDEGTSLYDDDGDGFAEVNNDCDDGDDTRSPSSIEYCDGVDNDCDGLVDSADACTDTDAEPIIVGKTIYMSASACLAGESVTMSVKVYDADGQQPSYTWTDDATNTFDNSNAQTVHWDCPTPTAETGDIKTIYVVVLDPDTNQDWAFDKIAVYPSDYPLHENYLRQVEAEEEDSDSLFQCGVSPRAPGAGIGLAGAALALALRRRRQGQVG